HAPIRQEPISTARVEAPEVAKMAITHDITLRKIRPVRAHKARVEERDLNLLRQIDISDAPQGAFPPGSGPRTKKMAWTRRAFADNDGIAQTACNLRDSDGRFRRVVNNVEIFYG